MMPDTVIEKKIKNIEARVEDLEKMLFGLSVDIVGENNHDYEILGYVITASVVSYENKFTCPKLVSAICSVRRPSDSQEFKIGDLIRENLIPETYKIKGFQITKTGDMGVIIESDLGDGLVPLRKISHLEKWQSIK